MGDCDGCRRGLLQAGLAGAAILVVPGCGGANDSGPGDASADDAGEDGGAGEGGDGGACQPTCSAGTNAVTLTFEKYPKLQNVGGSATIRATGYSDPSCHADFIIVVQPTAGTYVAFSAACSHLCCTVGYDAKHTQFLCPCHQSTYNLSGVVTGGPAPRNLQKLSVCADECGVTVTFP